MRVDLFTYKITSSELIYYRSKAKKLALRGRGSNRVFRMIMGEALKLDRKLKDVDAAMGFRSTPTGNYVIEPVLPFRKYPTAKEVLRDDITWAFIAFCVWAMLILGFFV